MEFECGEKFDCYSSWKHLTKSYFKLDIITMEHNYDIIFD